MPLVLKLAIAVALIAYALWWLIDLADLFGRPNGGP